MSPDLGLLKQGERFPSAGAAWGDVQAQPLLFGKFLGFRERWAFEDERPRCHILGQRVFLLLFYNESGGCRGGQGVLFSVCCHHLRWFSLISSDKALAALLLLLCLQRCRARGTSHGWLTVPTYTASRPRGRAPLHHNQGTYACVCAKVLRKGSRQRLPKLCLKLRFLRAAHPTYAGSRWGKYPHFVTPAREIKPAKQSLSYACSLLKAQLQVWSKRSVIDSVHLHIRSVKSVYLVHTQEKQRMHLTTEI